MSPRSAALRSLGSARRGIEDEQDEEKEAVAEAMGSTVEGEAKNGAATIGEASGVRAVDGSIMEPEADDADAESPSGVVASWRTGGGWDGHRGGVDPGTPDGAGDINEDVMVG